MKAGLSAGLSLGVGPGVGAGMGAGTSVGARPGSAVSSRLEVHEGPAPLSLRGGAGSADSGGLTPERLHQFGSMNISEDSVMGSAPGTPNRL